jgi:hypothetical protein
MSGGGGNGGGSKRGGGRGGDKGPATVWREWANTGTFGVVALRMSPREAHTLWPPRGRHDLSARHLTESRLEGPNSK